MRWTRLFDDLEAQVRQMERSDEAAQVAEHIRSERGRVSLVEALAADKGTEVNVQASGVGRVVGAISDVGEDWFTLDVDIQGPPRRRSLLLPSSSIQSVGGLSGFVEQRESVSARRFGLRLALRALSRDRASVRVHLANDTVTGTIGRVGHDHLDLSEHPDDLPPRRGQVRTRLAIPFRSLCAVRQI